jgi:hypothetical protein
MRKVTFVGIDGKHYSCEVDLLPTDSTAHIVEKISVEHANNGGDPAPTFIQRIISQEKIN